MNFSKACRYVNINPGSVGTYMRRNHITHQQAFDRFLQKKVGIS